MITRKNNIEPTGFTIIEVLVATLIIIVAFGAIMGLSVSSIKTNRLTKSQVIANGLAREGIEMVRALRDSRWKICPADAAENCWRLITSSETEPKDGVIYRIGKNFFQEAAPILLEEVSDQSKTRIIFCKSDLGDVYVHDNVEVECESSEKTRFRREITFHEGDVPDLDGQEIPASDFLVVTSKVIWTDNEKEHAYTLREVLYNWKRL